MGLHRRVARAAEGELPDWTRATHERREHMKRVAELLRKWAAARKLDDTETRRWTAAGHLHDVLRDADPDELRGQVPAELRTLPPLLLHGPAAAERLRSDGVADEELLQALTHHTVGHPLFGELGRCLYAADFLEPGRDFRNEWRRELRRRMSECADGVVRDVVGARLAHRLEVGGPLHDETVAFWNVLVDGDR